MADLTITLGQIRAHRPCSDGWQKLLTARGFSDGKFPDDHRVSLGDIAQSNGLDDAWWVAEHLAEEMPHEFIRLLREFAYRSAMRASVYTTDQRVHDCLTATRQHLDGVEGVDLAAAGDAAWAAARAAAWAARAAWDAAGDAARDAEVADLVELFGVTECGQ